MMANMGIPNNFHIRKLHLSLLFVWWWIWIWIPRWIWTWPLSCISLWPGRRFILLSTLNSTIHVWLENRHDYAYEYWCYYCDGEGDVYKHERGGGEDESEDDGERLDGYECGGAEQCTLEVWSGHGDEHTLRHESQGEDEYVSGMNMDMTTTTDVDGCRNNSAYEC